MKTERKGLIDIAKEATIIGVLAIGGYTLGAGLSNVAIRYFPEERIQQQSLKQVYSELDLGNMNWAKYLLIR